MIEVEHLTKFYGPIAAIQNLSFRVEKGEILGFLGPNGAGKTTLFRIILDLVRPTEGRVLLEGSDVSKTEDWKHRVGSYLDEHMLLSYLTPAEYFETLRKIYGLSKEDLRLHLEQFKEFFNEEILEKDKYIRDLSKGNLKKVGVAAALLGDPDVVLLDEPFENLDPSSQIRLKKLINKKGTERQTTFLISSHDLTHVTDICERIVLLEKGTIIQDLKEEKEGMIHALEEYFEG
jgi:ABC-2 type transport system ATP-binding protein